MTRDEALAYLNSLGLHNLSTSHYMVEKAKLIGIMDALLTKPELDFPLIDHAGEMTERCHEAEWRLERSEEEATRYWRDRQTAREFARELLRLAELPADHPHRQEDLDDLRGPMGEWGHE